MTKLLGTVCVTILFVFGVFVSCNADAIDNLFSNEAYVRKQINCVMNRGPCDMFGQQLIETLKEVIGNDCRNCTPPRRQAAERVKRIMNERYHNDWVEIVNYYQPNPALRRYN